MSVSMDDYDREFARPGDTSSETTTTTTMTVGEAFDVVMSDGRGRDAGALDQAEAVLEADRAAQVTCEALVDEIAELRRSRLKLTAAEAALQSKAEAQQVIQETASATEAATKLTGLRDALKAKSA